MGLYRPTTCHGAVLFSLLHCMQSWRWRDAVSAALCCTQSFRSMFKKGGTKAVTRLNCAAKCRKHYFTDATRDYTAYCLCERARKRRFMFLRRDRRSRVACEARASASATSLASCSPLSNTCACPAVQGCSRSSNSRTNSNTICRCVASQQHTTQHNTTHTHTHTHTHT